ncbi:MAG: MtrB/PioB family decaheme-associated outer membrane protein [Beijerinckiaceae bacterium]
MTCRTTLMTASAMCALIAALASAGPAQAADLPTRKSVPMLLDTSWYTEGEVEVGGRFFLNHPQQGAMPNMGQSQAAYYRYQWLAPGPFGNLAIAAGTRDGVRRVEMFGNNIGYRDQAYGLSYSHAGQYYIDLGWNQIPYTYSTSAQTIYNGVGGNYLGLIPGLSANLYNAAGGAGAALAFPGNAAQAANVWTLLNAASHQQYIGITRSTGTADARWTPTDAWDVRAYFENINRQGTMPWQMSFTANTSGVVAQVPKPINDNTKNYGLNAEYQGQTFWDKTYTFKLGYRGSTYTDNVNGFVVENPFCLNAATCARASGPLALMSTPPSNMANGVVSTLALDLPWKARYVGSLNVTRMQQNDTFQPFSINTIAGAPGATGFPFLPASGLNGMVDTVLFNNVLTKDITSELKGKVSYRLYDYNNRTPELYFNNWVITDSAFAKATTAQYAPVRSLSMSYTKQNAAAELNWRPMKTLTLGASYNYERYDWKREAATSTDENMVKAWMDYRPNGWFDFRSSASYARRTSNNYNYQINQAFYQWLTPAALPFPAGNGTSVFANPDYRIFYLSGRERAKIDAQADITVFDGLTVTPNFAYINDYYPMPYLPGSVLGTAAPAVLANSPSNIQQGLTSTQKVQAGIDATYQLTSSTKLFAFYLYEHTNRGYVGGTPGNNVLMGALGANPNPTSALYKMSAGEYVNTFRVGVDSDIIPRLNMKASYTLAKGTASQALPFVSGLTLPSFINYPNMQTMYQQADFGLKYTFADDWLKSMGLAGKMSAGLNYTWQRNIVNNWQAETLNYMWNANLTGVGYMAFMGWYNPNYNIHRLAASVSYKW